MNDITYRRLTLTKYQFSVHYFPCLILNIAHFLRPQHLIFSFEFFCYAFFCGKLFYHPKKHIFRLFINISKVTVQFSTCEKIEIENSAILFEIPQMPLSPNADRLCFFFRAVSNRGADSLLSAYKCRPFSQKLSFP